MEINITLADEAATIEFGQKVGSMLLGGMTVFLEGTLGAGKTTFCRGVLSNFGYSSSVKSPTYTLVEPYVFSGLSIYHFDLYRLADPEELEYMGIREYFSECSICLIEWPTRGLGVIPDPDLQFFFDVKGQGRRVRVQALSDRSKIVMKSFSGE